MNDSSPPWPASRVTGRLGPSHADASRDLRALDPRQLECFIVVAEELNLKRAALRLYMAQPPLTRRVHRLEEAVGAELFHRWATGMELTEAGAELLTHAYRMVEFSHNTLQRVALAKAGEVGTLNIGYNDPAVVAGIPQLLRAFVTEHPHADVRFRWVAKQAQVPYLRDRSLHVAFGREVIDEAGIEVRTVITEDLYVAYRPDVHSVPAGELTPRDLRGLPLVTYPDRQGGFMEELFRKCREAGFAPVVVAEADDIVGTLAYVAVGTAMGVVPESATAVHAHGVTFRKLHTMTRVEVVCSYTAKNRSPTLELFIRFLDTNT